MPAALRTMQLAEGVYAVVAGVLAFALPLPPRGPVIVLFAHWLGTALLAAAISLRLTRPNRQTWYVAALLSAYILFNAVVAIARLFGPESSTLGMPATVAIVVGAFVCLTQIVVAACLYQSRELRTMPSPGTRTARR
jgi:hypothetical protein